MTIRESDAGGPTAHVGRLLAEGLGAKIGDWINGLAEDRGFSARITEIVNTESEEYDRFFVELSYSAFGGLDASTISSLSVQTRLGADLHRVMADIKAVFADTGGAEPTIGLYTSPTGYVSSVKGIYGSNLAFIMIVIAVTVFFAIAAAFTMAIMERMAELGTIRSFGGNRRHIARLFQWEAFFLSLYGFVFGLVLAFAVGFTVNLLGGISLPPPPTVSGAFRLGFDPSLAYPAIAFALVFGVGQISSFIVTRRAGKLDIVALLGLGQ